MVQLVDLVWHALHKKLRYVLVCQKVTSLYGVVYVRLLVVALLLIENCRSARLRQKPSGIA